MSGIIETLIFRMNDKDVPPVELPRLIKDVMIIITGAPEHTLESVNRKLARLGWREEVLDPYTFELILQFIETESGDTAVRHTVH